MGGTATMKPKRDTVIDPLADAKAIIEKNGNTFHFKVVDFLRAHGWETQISPYYTDNITDKPREIDILAEKRHDFPTHFYGPFVIDCRLFVECKHVGNQKTVFWFDSIDQKSADRLVRRKFGFPQNNATPNQMRYLDDRNFSVAKLFASGSGEKSSENELMFKAINQALGSYIYGDNGRLLEQPFCKIERIIPYPVIVCNNFDGFFRINRNDESTLTSMADMDSFLVEINYAYKDKTGSSQQEYFLVDIVNFEKMREFLEKSLYGDPKSDINVLISFI